MEELEIDGITTGRYTEEIWVCIKLWINHQDAKRFKITYPISYDSDIGTDKYLLEQLDMETSGIPIQEITFGSNF